MRDRLRLLPGEFFFSSLFFLVFQARVFQAGRREVAGNTVSVHIGHKEDYPPQCDTLPEPHAILLVLPALRGSIGESERGNLKHHVEPLRKSVWRKTMVLLTMGHCPRRLSH